MEYTVNKLAGMAGVSSRTLRYYDEIGLLSPKRINSSGYRIYGEKEVDMLQQILFYRALEISLDEIKMIIKKPGFDTVQALLHHREALLEKQMMTQRLIQLVDQTLAAKEGSKPMSDTEKFQGFKKEMIDKNEKKYGAEIRKKYGDKAIDASNKKVMNMSQKDHEEITALTQSMHETMVEALTTGDPGCDLAQEAVDMHRQWLNFYVDMYSSQYHRGLADMYVADARFKQHYEDLAIGLTEFLREAIYIYTEEK